MSSSSGPERAWTRTARLARAFVDLSPSATLAFDLEGRIVFWSAAAERLFGWQAHEVVGRPCPPESIPRGEEEAAADLMRRAQAGASIRGEQVRRFSRDRRELIVEIYGAPVHDRHGVAVGYASHVVDVTPLHAMAADLALVANVGSLLAGVVQSLGPEASLEQAAQRICDRLTSLPLVDVTAIGAFDEDHGATLIASAAPRSFPMRAGDSLPPRLAAELVQKAAGGPWAEYWESSPDDGDWGRRMDRAGLKGFAFGPLVHGDHVDGGVVIGTRNAAFARTLVEKWASVVDFSTTPSAILAEGLHARRFARASRRRYARMIDERAFEPVFQPIVELATGQVVGHEALTRFECDVRADLCFAQAWAVGLGPDLEFATMTAAIDRARSLPQGLWLDLNVSPRLLHQADRLRATLCVADRPIVLEVTEHEAIDDYGAIRDVVRTLGHDVRLAVDDAGAGVANFAHIVELGPDFVKLDHGLIRRVNGNLGRQALVVGMRHFARTAGCRLVAEGIETEDEARTLTALGVEFGQGYWFGRPEPVRVPRGRRTKPPGRRCDPDPSDEEG